MTESKLLPQSEADASNQPPKHLQLDNQICFPLYSASNAIIRAYRPYLDELDITYLQYIVLMVLWEKHSLNVKELSQRLMLKSGTLTPLLKRLDAKGLVVRKRCEHDERARIITITAKGKKLQKRAEPIPKKIVNEVGLDVVQLQQFSQLCKQVLASQKFEV